jgi:hypothetical protein
MTHEPHGAHGSSGPMEPWRPRVPQVPLDAGERRSSPGIAIITSVAGPRCCSRKMGPILLVRRQKRPAGSRLEKRSLKLLLLHSKQPGVDLTTKDP